ncbi:unnamed protein product [Trichobilharzia regenti]|nr:unnamed protein product [Trichobilharzia regenti]
MLKLFTDINNNSVINVLNVIDNDDYHDDENNDDDKVYAHDDNNNEGIVSRNQRKDDILRQFVVSIFQKDIEDAEDSCNQHQTKFTQNLIKLSIPILLENGYDNLLMKWIKRNM